MACYFTRNFQKMCAIDFRINITLTNLLRRTGVRRVRGRRRRPANGPRSRSWRLPPRCCAAKRPPPPPPGRWNRPCGWPPSSCGGDWSRAPTGNMSAPAGASADRHSAWWRRRRRPASGGASRRAPGVPGSRTATAAASSATACSGCWAPSRGSCSLNSHCSSLHRVLWGLRFVCGRCFIRR